MGILPLIQNACPLPGASTRDPTHDKVMRRKPDEQGGSGFQGFRKAVPGAHLKVHWEDPEESDGEGDGRGDRDGEYM